MELSKYINSYPSITKTATPSIPTYYAYSRTKLQTRYLHQSAPEKHALRPRHGRGVYSADVEANNQYVFSRPPPPEIWKGTHHHPRVQPNLPKMPVRRAAFPALLIPSLRVQSHYRGQCLNITKARSKSSGVWPSVGRGINRTAGDSKNYFLFHSL